MNEDSVVSQFREKPVGDGAWINGGFFVLEPGAIDRVKNGDQNHLGERAVRVACFRLQLSAYKHAGFWRPMDTMRDKAELESLWNSGRAPGKSGIAEITAIVFAERYINRNVLITGHTGFREAG